MIEGILIWQKYIHVNRYNYVVKLYMKLKIDIS